MIIVDTSGLLAALDASERWHSRAATALRTAGPPRFVSPFVLAELDYLVGRHVSTSAAQALHREVVRGAYRLETFDADDLAEALVVMGRYPGLDLGLADASLVVLAERHAVTDILTLDERHFRQIRDANGRAFRLLPADAD